ncbi:olfactory receptor 14J1-like, partial [Caloenas nicobarica]|uniref:olfactory receptor 14J1-like n=1 Tax=Caloenas nicobarica TaxID=187106 RepID=UPI0032B792E9
LHYGTLLGSRACVHMAAAAWATGFLNALLHTANTFSLPLCKGNALDQFFCEIPQILKLSCSDAYLREVWLLVGTVCLTFGCFVFIVLSYVQILRAVLRIPSEQGRHKAFSTCLPHLAVVSLFVSTAMFAHLKPPSISFPSLELVVSVLYSVVPPANKEEHGQRLDKGLEVTQRTSKRPLNRGDAVGFWQANRGLFRPAQLSLDGEKKAVIGLNPWERGGAKKHKRQFPTGHHGAHTTKGSRVMTEDQQDAAFGT